MNADDNNIVNLYGAGSEIVKKTPTLPGWCEAQCKNIEVDSEYRIIKCSHCGRVLDPFDYLLRWANDHDRRLTRMKEMDVEEKKKRTALGLLEQAVKRERARLRRVNPQATELNRSVIYSV